MKKQINLKEPFFALLFCMGFLLATAQQNQKIIFPTPAGFATSTGQSLISTADGGFLLTGTADTNDNWQVFGIRTQARLIKLNANHQTQWDQTYLPPAPNRGTLCFPVGETVEMPDGSFIQGLHSDSSVVEEVMKVNADGSVAWVKDLPNYSRESPVIGLLPNGNVLVVRDEYISNSAKLYQLDTDGNIVFSVNMPFYLDYSGGVRILSNGDLLFNVYNFSNQKTKLYRTDDQGNILWTSGNLTGNWQRLLALPGGGFGHVVSNGIVDFKIDYFGADNLANGSSPNYPLSGTVLENLKRYPDGSLLLSGKTASQRGFMAKLAADASPVWAVESPEDGQPHLKSLNGIPTNDGWAAGAGYTLGTQFGFLRVYENTGIFINQLSGRVAKDDNQNCGVEGAEPGIAQAEIVASNGTESFYAFTSNGHYNISLPAGNYNISVKTNELFFHLCPTAIANANFLPQANGNLTLDFPMQTDALVHLLKGRAVLDMDGDCAVGPDAPPAPNLSILITQGSQFRHLKTDNNGEYQIFAPEGTLNVTLYPLNDHYGICGQSTRVVNLTGSTPITATEDFVTFPEVDCALMRTIISNTSGIRPCTTYTRDFHYRNDGTQTAENATLEISLDPSLHYISSLPAATVTGNLLHFELGDVPPQPGGFWNHVSVTFEADCGLQIGQQACVSAVISPNSPCTEPPSWQGAIITVEGQCENDSAVFTIKNIGNGVQTNALNFIIAEDQIVLRMDHFNIPPGGQQTEKVKILNPNSTLNIIAEQQMGAPGDTSVSFSLTNCMGMGGGNPGGNGGSSGIFSANACFQVANSFDPNDKSAFPLGFGPSHLVRPGTPLDYSIRFQNTGNDTAFTVILRDTLSSKMDFGKIEVLCASHPYAFAQVNDSILHIRFDNILLPDSLSNPGGSQGYISFRIYPKADLPQGTVVENRAAIYFDHNAPIITNTVSRTYGDYFVVKTDEAPGKFRLNIACMPNPFVSETTFNLPEDAPSGEYQLEILDAAGRLLRSLNFSEKQCRLERGHLPSGLLFWKVAKNGQVLASGRILAGE